MTKLVCEGLIAGCLCHLCEAVRHREPEHGHQETERMVVAPFHQATNTTSHQSATFELPLNRNIFLIQEQAD